jgi:hypothetical protein
MSKVLTPARRARLEKLAAYLEELPADYAHFDMTTYVAEDKGDESLKKYALHNGGVQHCGTAACAVGHGPAAGIFMPKSVAARFGKDPFYRVWNAYAQLFIGPDRLSPKSANSDYFEWLFGEDWNTVDNSHYGAAARIRYLLDKGLPEDFLPYACGGDAWEPMLALYAPYRIDAEAVAA